MQLTETAACVAGHGAYKGTNYFVDETTGRCAADATSTTVWQLTVHAQIGHSSQLHSNGKLARRMATGGVEGEEDDGRDRPARP